MQVVVLATESQRAELIPNADSGIVWIEDETAFDHYPSAGAFVDLQYVNTPKRRARLQSLLPKTVIVNSVTETLAEMEEAFIRINGWNTFLSAPLLEAACSHEVQKEKAGAVFSLLGKTAAWLPDAPGFVTARVVCAMINEAYWMLGEGVSTKKECNTAMKLGTAYPYGPFEWAEKIGLSSVVGLLHRLSQVQPHYQPAGRLLQEAQAT